MLNKQLYLLLFIFILIPLVSSAPPAQVNLNTQVGLQIYYPQIETLEQNINYRFEVSVSNLSDGKEIPNSILNCGLNLHNATGHNLFDMNMSKENDYEHVTDIDGGNFSSLGFYGWKVYCADGLGGTAQGVFEVTYNGDKISLTNTILIIAFLLMAGVFLVLSFAFKEEHWILRTFFNFAAVGMGVLALNSAKIISSESIGLVKMGNVGLLIGIIVLGLFFLYMFVYAFIETIKVIKDKRGLRWEY